MFQKPTISIGTPFTFRGTPFHVDLDKVLDLMTSDFRHIRRFEFTFIFKSCPVIARRVPIDSVYSRDDRRRQNTYRDIDARGRETRLELRTTHQRTVMDYNDKLPPGSVVNTVFRHWVVV